MPLKYNLGELVDDAIKGNVDGVADVLAAYGSASEIFRVVAQYALERGHSDSVAHLCDLLEKQLKFHNREITQQ